MISEFWRFGFLSWFVAYLPRTNLWFILMPYLKPRWRRWLKWICAIPSNTKKSATKAVDGSQDSLLAKFSPMVRCLPRKRRLCLIWKQKVMYSNVQFLYHFMREKYVGQVKLSQNPTNSESVRYIVIMYWASGFSDGLLNDR